MNTEETKKKKNILKVIVILIILILLVVLIGYGWAKYVSSKGGDATAQVAKWSFKVVDGISETEDVLDFAVTRTDNNEDVEPKILAPGTYGKFEIDIDARETETDVGCKIKIHLNNKPQNLKIYEDIGKTCEVNIQNNEFEINKYYTIEDVKNIQPQIFYWDWPMETGTTEDEILENDEIDSSFMGQTMSMDINVTGVQTMGYAGMTYDLNYFADDLLSESETIKDEYTFNYEKYDKVETESNKNAKYGKSVKFTMKNGSIEDFAGPYFNKALENGKIYTWSMYVKTSSDRLLSIGHNKGGSLNVNVDTNWQRFTHTFTANGSLSAFRFYNRNEIWQEGDTIEFHSLEIREGNSLNILTESKELNKPIGELRNPKREGYTFIGWYTDPVNGEKISQDTTVTGNITYYAHWEYNRLINI